MGASPTSFKPRNDAWKARSKHGPNPKFSGPDELWDACCEYFEWCSSNPLTVVELVKFQGESKQAEVPLMRNMSLDGLLTYLDIVNSTWLRFRDNPDLSTVTEKVDRIIRTHKMDGAVSGQFNANIIARELGLADKSEVAVKELEVAGDILFKKDKGGG